MSAKYLHISYGFGQSFQIEKFDKTYPCSHKGLHFHDSYEIVFIKNGHGKIVVEGTEITYQNGVLVFLGPCIPHFSFFNNDRTDNLEVVIHFDEDFVQEKLKSFPEFSHLLPFIHQAKQFLVFEPRIKHKYSTLLEGICELSPPEQLISIFHLLIGLAKVPAPHTLLKAGVGDRYARNKQIGKIFEFINKNYTRPISTNDLADYVGLTTNSFCRMFKKLTNKSFITYLNEYRIYQATKLLEETDDTISEIMYRCGFENPSYFARKFLALRDVSPLAYRKKYRETQANLTSNYPSQIN